ncbi:HNH endonuclease signature motif containing protein [Lacticaseibacillus paracasei]|uniref:HNH endonuclease signature motif containing protein n=1 Tax=Lacticaseibacillus paracasei TaxID=1597 RepID=UPI00202ED452|nr:HNH endonuclease signature motif containing protein [Lacticaseibacillus paracasei]URW92437.1 HNH endonuclease [Lacticaseibacillus paracasei]
MVMKLCNHAGCKTLVPFNQAFCEKHQPKPMTDDYDRYAHRKAVGGRYFKFYRSKVWRKLSYSYRLAHPLCERCQAKGLYVQADVVDHIVPIRVDWSRRLDESNLQSLCNSCHWQKTKHEDPGASPSSYGG